MTAFSSSIAYLSQSIWGMRILILLAPFILVPEDFTQIGDNSHPKATIGSRANKKTTTILLDRSLVLLSPAIGTVFLVTALSQLYIQFQRYGIPVPQGLLEERALALGTGVLLLTTYLNAVARKVTYHLLSYNAPHRILPQWSLDFWIIQGASVLVIFGIILWCLVMLITLSVPLLLKFLLLIGVLALGTFLRLEWLLRQERHCRGYTRATLKLWRLASRITTGVFTALALLLLWWLWPHAT